MNSRNIALVALALAAVLFLVPVCSEQSDAVSSEDISLTLPDSTGDSVSITVGNGGSTDFRFYVYNNSDQYLYMTAEGASDSDFVDVSATVGGEYLLPYGASDTGHILPVDVHVSVGRYDESPTESGSIILTFADMAGSGETFEVTVGIQITVDSAYYSADGNNKFLGIIPNTLDGALGSE